MSLTEPAIRAAISQSLLATVGRLDARERQEIFAAAGGGTTATIESALPVSWMPMPVHMALSDAVRDVVGSERSIEMWCTTMRNAFDRPLLRGFVRMSTELFGMTPLALLKRGDLLYAHVTRELGTCAFAADGRTRDGRVTLSGFPSDRFRLDCFTDGLAGSLRALLLVCNATGSVTVTHQDDTRGDVTYRVRWAPAAATWDARR